MKDEDRYQEIYDLNKEGKHTQAKQRIDEWLQDQPDNIKALSTLTHYYILIHEYDNAEKTCLKCMEFEPTEPAFHFTMGRIQFKKDNIENAAKYFKQARDISVEKDWIYYLKSAQFSYAYCSYLLGNTDVAKQELKDLPDDLGSWFKEYVNVGMLKEKLTSNPSSKVTP